MRSTLVLVAAIALLVIAGCAPKAAMPQAAPGATDKAVDDVSSAVSDLDTISEDLDMSDLNALDQELADLETLELQ